MNERIRELADQVELTIRDQRGNTYMSHPEFNKKFAELIVRECAELCLNNETFQGMFNTMEYRKGRHFNSIIKEHFGVEE